MSRLVVAGFSACLLLGAGLVVAQTQPSTESPGEAMANTRIAVIDIERIAAESNEGKKLFENLKTENDKIMAQRQKLEQEIREMQAKANSEILSQDARVRLQRDIQKKQTDAQRWLEDAQADFEAKRQDGEQKFQAKLAPIRLWTSVPSSSRNWMSPRPPPPRLTAPPNHHHRNLERLQQEFRTSGS
jgi:Skp family chaperone for outer membrane proteins